MTQDSLKYTLNFNEKCLTFVQIEEGTFDQNLVNDFDFVCYLCLTKSEDEKLVPSRASPSFLFLVGSVLVFGSLEVRRLGQ